MKLAIIGASYLQLPVYLKAHELGFETIGFAWLKDAVAKDYCYKFYPISILEKELILEVCQREKINGILSIASDSAVPTVNYVASKLGLTGNSNDSGLYSTNKYFMRERIKAAGLNCPRFILIERYSDIEAKKSLINYPAIVKPVDRSGSIGVTKVLNLSELIIALSYALKASFVHKAIVEDFIDGYEVSAELLSFNGVHYGLTITDKATSGTPHFIELAHHQPSIIPQNLQSEIFEIAKKGLDALEIKNGASHPEFIISSGKIFITEIGSRMGGDFIGSDLVYLSSGYDFLKGVIQVAVGEFEIPQIKYKKYSGVYFYSELTRNVRELIKSDEVQPFKVRAEICSEKLIPLKQSSDRAGYFIYQDEKKLTF
jgi:biotin carboxylase